MKKEIITAVAGVSLAAGTAFGVSKAASGEAIVPQLPEAVTATTFEVEDFLKEEFRVAEVMQSGVAGLQLAGAVALGGSISMLGYQVLRRRWTELELSAKGYTQEAGERSGKLHAIVAGTMVPTIITAAAMTGLTLEKEVGQESQKIVEVIADKFEQGEDSGLLWITAAGTEHFMNESSLSEDQTRRIVRSVPEAVPIKRDLVSVQSHIGEQTSFVVGVPGALLDELNARPNNLERYVQSLGPWVATDAGEGLELGDSVEIRGKHYHVGKLLDEPISIQNRIGFITSTETFEDFNDDPSNYAVLVPTSNDTKSEIIKQLPRS